MFLKDHFGAIVTNVVALIMGLFMALTAIFLDHLALNWVNLFKIWATIVLVIILVSWLVPYVKWGNALAGLFGLKSNGLGFSLISGLVPALLFNTICSLLVSATNIFYNPVIPQAVRMSIWINGFLRDFLPMLVVSYFAAFIAQAIGVRLAKKFVLGK